MNTLHLCHWHSRNHFEKHANLITSQDSLVIYGHINASDKLWIGRYLKHTQQTWHLVNQQANPNNKPHEIDNDQWLTLIIEHKNTLAWK